MAIQLPPGISSRRGLHRVVVDTLGLRIVSGELGEGGLNRAHRLELEAASAMEALIASTARDAGRVVERRPTTGRNT